MSHHFLCRTKVAEGNVSKELKRFLSCCAVELKLTKEFIVPSMTLLLVLQFLTPFIHKIPFKSHANSDLYFVSAFSDARFMTTTMKKYELACAYLPLCKYVSLEFKFEWASHQDLYNGRDGKTCDWSQGVTRSNINPAQLQMRSKNLYQCRLFWFYNQRVSRSWSGGESMSALSFERNSASVYWSNLAGYLMKWSKFRLSRPHVLVIVSLVRFYTYTLMYRYTKIHQDIPRYTACSVDLNKYLHVFVSGHSVDEWLQKN